MNSLRKIMAVLIGMIMVFAISGMVSGATITVENADPAVDINTTRETYTAYKIFDAVKTQGTIVTTLENDTEQTADGGITYQITTDSPWFAVLFEADGSAKEGNAWFTARAIPGAANTYQVIPDDTFSTENAAIAAADWLLANKGDITGTQLVVSQENTVDDGYYLVTSSLGTNLGLATTDIPMRIVEKNQYPSIDKKQKDDSSADTAYADEDVIVQVGDTVYYEVIVNVPATAKGTIDVTDTMSSGLDYVSDSMSIQVDDEELEETAYTAGTKAETDTWSWKYTIPVDSVLGKNIVFTFTATVNDDAIITDTAKQNEVQLDYSNYSQKDTVFYKTGASGAVKFDGNTATVNEETNALVKAANAQSIKYLADAKFQLQLNGENLSVSRHEDGYYYPDLEGTAEITSDANGIIVIRGLDIDDSKTYTLTETQAPAGYNLLTEAVPLLIEANNTSAEGKPLADLSETAQVKIENRAGSILPSTGGIGTTIFYIIGGVIVVAAVIFLIIRRKKNSSK